MEHSAFTRVFLVIFALLSLFFSIFLIANAICRTSLRMCHTISDCDPGAVCINQGGESLVCAPEACQTAEAKYQKFGVQSVGRYIIAFTATESAVFGKWMVTNEDRIKKSLEKNNVHIPTFVQH